MLRILLLFSVLIAVINGAVNPNCTIRSFKTSLLEGDSGMSSTDLNAYITSIMRNITLVDLSTTHLSCIESRSSSGILGANGGDSGEFLTALAIFNQYNGSVTTDSAVYNLLDSFLSTLDSSRKFYMHTDQTAYNNLLNATGDPNFDIKTVAASNRSRVLDLLIMSENIGCKVINLFLNNPGGYHVPVELTQRYIRAFFTWMWNNPTSSKLVYQISPSYIPSFSGLLDIYSTTDSACANMHPVLPSSSTFNSTSLNFLLYSQVAVTKFRNQISNFFVTQQSNIKTNETFLQKMTVLANNQLSNILYALARDTTFYIVRFEVGLNSTVSTTGVSTGLSTSGKMSTTSTDDDSSSDGDSASPTTSKGKGWVGIIVVFVLLAIFLAITWIMWQYYPKLFATHFSKPAHKQTGDAHPHREQQKEDSEFVPLEDYQRDDDV